MVLGTDLGAKLTSLVDNRKRTVLLVVFTVTSGLYSILFYELAIDTAFESISPFPLLIDVLIAAVVWMGVLAFTVAYSALGE